MTTTSEPIPVTGGQLVNDPPDEHEHRFFLSPGGVLTCSCGETLHDDEPVADHLFHKMQDTAGGYVYVHGDGCPAWTRHAAEILVDRLLRRQAPGCTCGLPPSKEHR